MNLKEFFTQPHKPFEYAGFAAFVASALVWFGPGPALAVLGLGLTGEALDLREKVVNSR